MTSSSQRQVEALRWDHATLFPKYHLLYEVALVESSGALMAKDYRFLFEAARNVGLPRADRPDGQRLPARFLLDALGAEWLVLPDSIRLPQTVPIRVAVPDIPDVLASRNPRAFPRAWIVHAVEQLPPLPTTDPQALLYQSRKVLLRGNRPRDFRREAVVETDRDLRKAAAVATVQERASDRREHCRVVGYGREAIELNVRLREPGLIVLSDLYYPGWVATVKGTGEASSRKVPVLRTNRVMRGVYLPAGNFRVRFLYRPIALYWGALVSGCGGFALAVAAGVFGAKRWRRKPPAAV